MIIVYFKRYFDSNFDTTNHFPLALIINSIFFPYFTGKKALLWFKIALFCEERNKDYFVKNDKISAKC